MSSVTRVLIVHDSGGGNTAAMARRVARGVESVAGCEAVVRRVAPLAPANAPRDDAVPESGAPHAEAADLERCDALVLGSPTHFGNMSASLKGWLDGTTAQWFAGALAGKPAAAFTSTGSLHGGQESTVLSMTLPLLHHGALIVGLPYTNPELMRTRSGGTPYGASHVSGEAGDRELDEDEARLCAALGARVARAAVALARARAEGAGP